MNEFRSRNGTGTHTDKMRATVGMVRWFYGFVRVISR